MAEQGAGRPSLSAVGPGGVPSPGAGPVVTGDRERCARRAAYDEGRMTLRIAAATTLPIGLLLLLAASVRWDLWPSVAPAEPWAGSMATLVLLLVALQLVSVLIAVEHLTYGASGGRLAGAIALVWLFRGLVVAAVVAALLAGRDGWADWSTVVRRGSQVEVAALAVVTLGFLLLRAAVGGPGPVGPSPDGSAPVTASVDTGGQLLAIGASGGGLRAAAFVLGGHQAVQDSSAGLRCGRPGQEPPLFAVSGGSYIAAALALRRGFAADGRRREPPTPWTDAYAVASPEVERLRRHTRYLFQPASRARDGLVSLLMGASVNLAILALALRFLTWVSGQVAATVGLVRATRTPDGELLDLAFAPGWRLDREWLYLLALPLACLVAMVVVTFVGWRSTAVFDEEESEPLRRRLALGSLRVSEHVRPLLLGLAAAWLLVAVLLPAVSVQVVELTTSNRPTATAAGVLDRLGFGRRQLCQEAMVEQVHLAVDAVNDEARISPGETRQTTAGACGFETTVARTVDPRGDADPRNDVVIGPDDGAARALVSSRRLPGQVAGIALLMVLVVALLRRGPSPEASASTGRPARVRRWLLTWLPLLVMGTLGAYLTLLWTFRFLTLVDVDYTFTSAWLTVAACVLAYLVDANATSMHGFYRSRLSDAFAVGVDDETRVAAELPPATVYRFSDLLQRPGQPAGSTVPLHIVTTVNSQAANEAPAMRGGFPMVFGPATVEVHREAGQRVAVPTAAYEAFAGPGRVSIMATVATSGAAISPLMGRYGAQMAPYRLLLTLFNLRVGTWVRNPMHVGGGFPAPGGWGELLWLTRKPGLAQVALEAFGNSSANRRWLYLSDGGHLDNTGLVECVRHCLTVRRTGRVLVLDASNDPVDTWSAVGDAISVVRADLDVDLRRDPVADEPPWMRTYQGGGLEVLVVKAVRTGPPAAGGRDWLAELPPNVVSFQLVHQDFPRASTARQRFGDLEFEAYRAFGYAATRCAMMAAGWPALDEEAPEPVTPVARL
jgi:hypothetical protein